MKRILLALLLIVSVKGYSQAAWTNNIGATWYFSYNEWVTSGTIKRVYTGDTVINGRQLKVLTDWYYKATYIFPNNIPTQVLDTVIPFGKRFIQILGDSVLHYYPAYNSIPETSYLLYNFGAEIGDRWDILPYGSENCPYSTIEVTGKGVDTLNGIPVRWLYLSPLDSSAYGIWGKVNEYFGPTMFDMFPEFWWSCDENIVDETTCFIRCFDDGVIHYPDNPNFVCNPLSSINETLPSSSQFSIFPNPSQGITNINPANLAYGYNLTVYDMAGRQLQAINGLKGNYQLETTYLPQGLYTIRIEHAGKLYYHKLLVE